MAAGAPDYAGWAGAEMVFHEVSHALTGPDMSGHLCLFYITGEVWRSELAARGAQYEPYLYATGLLDRSWKSLRVPVETHLKPYVEGRVTSQAAFRALIEAIPE